MQLLASLSFPMTIQPPVLLGRWLATYSSALHKTTLTHWTSLVQMVMLMSAYHQTEEEMQAEYAIIVKSQRNPNYFGPIYERYYDSIFIFINRRLDDEEASADVTSIVFYKCLENIKRFKFQGVPFSAWLFRIALNEINQFFRRQKKHDRAVSIQDHHIEALFEEMEECPEDKHRVVTALLSSLSAEDLQFLELRFFEGHSFREIGYLLGLTEVNAKIKTYRILKKMKEKAQALING